MKLKECIVFAALIASPLQPAFGQFGGRIKIPDIQDIQKSIKSQQKSIQDAIEKAKRAKRDEAARLERERQQREAKLKAEAEAARKRQEEERRRLKELNDIKEFRKTTEALVKTVADLKEQLATSNEALTAANERLKAKEKAFEDERKLFDMEKKKFQLEKDLRDAQKTQAEDSGWKWFLGFSVSVLTLCVGGFAAFVDHRHKNAEIKKIQKDLEND